MSSGQPPTPPPGQPPSEGQPYGPQPPYGQPVQPGQPPYQPGQPPPGQYAQPLYGQPPGQPPQAGYGPPGYGQPTYQGPPPKQSHTLRNVLLILLGVLILLFVGCSVLVGTVINKADKTIKSEVSRHAPTTVQEGEEFTHDGFRVDGGWKIAAMDTVNLATVTGLKVTNEENGAFTGADGRSALLTFRLYQDDTVVAEINCNSRQMQEGESSAMQCVSGDSLPPDYNKIKVTDIFSGVASSSPNS